LDFIIKYLSNGVRLLHIPGTGPVAHMAVYINAGTRDEDPGKNGLAHFIEHTIFKGTKKRRAYHILTRLESVGGELNAFTTKEETCIFATFLKENFHRALELMADILTQSTFPDKELKKEKEVILDEINSYKDNPAEEIYDVLEEHIFEGHALGLNILGNPEHLVEFTREDILDFIANHYSGDQMVICTTGDLPFDRICHRIEKFLENVPHGADNKSRGHFDDYVPFNLVLPRQTYQAHCMLGNIAYDRKDGRRFTLYLVNNLLGGPAMNSRLNLAVRERHGYAYNIESVYLPYTDTGIFSIYLGTDNGNLEKSINLVYKELGLLCSKRMGGLQLSQAKKQLIGQIEIANESNLNYLLAAGKAFLHDQKLEEPDVIRKQIEAVTADQVMEVAKEIFEPAKMSRLIFRNE
jgi:predicted Zn-dependent peptidase